MILHGFDIPVSCLVDATIEQNSTILWGQFYPYYMLISETLKYTKNEIKLIIHNVSIEDGGEYACFSAETAMVYTVIDTFVTCT